jgi:uncharacterized protein (DUF4415 family)
MPTVRLDLSPLQSNNILEIQVDCHYNLLVITLDEAKRQATPLNPPKTVSRNPRDSDSPLWSEEMPGPPVLKPGRGPEKALTKVATAIRLDADVPAWFKSQCAGRTSYRLQEKDVRSTAFRRQA